MKNVLFLLFGYIGMAIIVFSMFLLLCHLSNKLFGIVKYIIMFREYSKNKELYDIRNNVIIGKSGNVRYSCAGDLDEQIKIIKMGLKYLEDGKKMKDAWKENI